MIAEQYFLTKNIKTDTLIRSVSKNRIGQKVGWQMVKRKEGKSKKIILKWMPGETTKV